jgi:hypothetical protein
MDTKKAIDRYHCHKQLPRQQPGNPPVCICGRRNRFNFDGFQIVQILRSIREYNINSNKSGDFLGPAIESFYPNNSQNVAFSINVTNLDLSQDNITLIQDSLFWIISPPVGGGAIKGQGWKIATVVDTKISALGAGNVLLPYNQTAIVYFGPDIVSSSNIQPGGIVANLLLVGTIGAKSYGQNLPFVSLIARNP